MKLASPRSRVVLAVAAVAGLALAALASCESDARRTRTPTSPPPPSDSLTLTLAPVGGTFAAPIFLTAPPNDPRLFVAEKGGRIQVVKNGTKLATPFLDLNPIVSKGGEQGLLGLAFAPDYAASGRFFVSYTDLAGDSRVVRYRVSAANADVADPAPQDTVLTVDQPYSNHNGGMICFGPDGMLYFGLGDGGSGGDPSGTGQDRRDLLGSTLRLDVRGDDGYAIPADNPYAGGTNPRPELWDYGLRNPWRFSFDRQTGDLWIGDVGQGDWEEVSMSPAVAGRNAGRGVNYGWRITEGTGCYPPGTTGCSTAGQRLPVHEYSHDEGNCIIGGYVYRGSLAPALRGHYFYADNGYGWMRSFKLAGGVATEHASWPLPAGSGGPMSFGEDAAGELYLLTSTGRVYRFEP